MTHFNAASLAAIPSPPFDALSLGPLRIQMYGLCIAAGVVAAVVIGQRRWRRWGGDPEDIVTVGIWAVPAGLVGARIYHVITDWNRLYSDGNWADAFKIWQGGLGIPGAVLLGSLVGIVVARRTVVDWRRFADMAAPAIPVAQAVGRLGNWFNQELFGSPTDLPWGLRIDAVNRPAEVVAAETFHPTFLYEGLWNLGLAGLIIWGSNRYILKPGRWFAVYLAGYGLGRLWVESLRIDDATLLAGLRVNIWMSLAVILFGLVWFGWGGGPLDRAATERLRAGESLADVLGPETAHVGSPSAGHGAADGVAEGRPGLDGPGSEVAIGEDDAAEPAGGVDPDKGA